MIDADKKIKNSTILILGVTFKENCSDMRNSKVINIIEVLKDYGCNVDVYDPWIDMSQYTDDTVMNPFQANKKYNAIILAVAHQQFKALSMEDYLLISDGQPIIIDVKSIVPNPTWRL